MPLQTERTHGLKTFKPIAWAALSWGLEACASPSAHIYWVSGSKAECSAGAGKMQCLRVSPNADLRQAKWQYFYAPIEGFVFEEGFLKKIEVQATPLDPKTVPAGASSIRYTLIKELEKVADDSANHPQ